MSQNDVLLGLGFSQDTKTSIDEVTQRIYRLDQQILSVQKNIAQTEKSLSKLSKSDPNYDGKKAENDASYRELKDLIRNVKAEQAATLRLLNNEASTILKNVSDPRQVKQIQSAVESTFKSLTDTFVNVQKAMMEQGVKFQQKLEKTQRDNLKRIEDQQKTTARNQENLRLSELRTNKNRDGALQVLTTGELRALSKQSLALSNTAQSKGGYDIAESYRKLSEDLSKELKRRYAPEEKLRKNVLSGLTNSSTLSEYLSYAKPTEIRQLRDDARKQASKYAKGLDVENAEKMASLASKLDSALKKVQPEIARLYDTANSIKLDPSHLRKIANNSVEQLSELQKAMVREAKKQFSAGNSKTGNLLSGTANQIQELIKDKVTPHLKTNLDELKRLALGDFQLSGKYTIAGLQALKRDADSESKRLTKIDRNDPLAERLRELSQRIQDLINVDKIKQEKSVYSQLSQYEQSLIRSAAKNRFDDSLYTTGNLKDIKAQSLLQQQEALKQTERLQKAQQLRYIKSLENNESKSTVELERKALDSANQRLQVMKSLVDETKKKNRAEESNSADNIEKAVRRDLMKSQTRRNLDNGAEQFRNQGILLRNYAVMGAGVGGAYSAADFTLSLDRSFKQLQSILALTNNEMEELEENLVTASEKTKFTAVEVTEAAIILGQAGLSKEQISESIEGITLFATAIGTDLKTAVDLATSTLGVYKIESARMNEVVDKLTTAVNSSKLNLEKLTLGIQYAGNIAAQSNVSFEETVAVLGAMANSGIRSGSTLGTGLRQVLITLQSPTEKFIDKITSLNLNMSQLDVRSHGLINVMTTLANAGFTVTDAMQSMEVRAAAAYGAFANNLEVAEELSLAMEQSGSASRANDVQMTALSNQWLRFGSIAKSLVFDALEPYLKVMTDILRVTGDFLQSIKDGGSIINFFIAAVTGIATVKVSKNLLELFSMLGSKGVQDTLKVVSGASVTAGSATLLSRALGSAAAGLSGPVGLGIGVLAAAGSYAYNRYQENKNLSDPLDLATASVSRNQAQLDKYNAWLQTLSQSLGTLYLKQADFSKGEAGTEELGKYIRKLNNDLKEMGFYLDSNSASFEDVSSKILELKKQVSEFKTQNITSSGELLAVRFNAQQEQSRVFNEQELNTQRYLSNWERSLNNEKFPNLDGRGSIGSLKLAQIINPNLNLDLADVLKQLQTLPLEQGVGAKAGDLRTQVQRYYNELAGVGNLPEEELLQHMTGLKGKISFAGLDNPSDYFRKAIQERLDLVAQYVEVADKIALDAKNYEAAQSKDPQKVFTIIQAIQAEFMPKLYEVMGDFSKDKNLVTEKQKGDAIKRLEEAEALKSRYASRVAELEEAAKVQSKNLLNEAFGDQYSGSLINKVLTDSGLAPETNATRTQLNSFVSQNRKPAEKAYYVQSEGRLGTLKESVDVVKLELDAAKTKEDIDHWVSELIKLEKEIALINKRRSDFKTPVEDTETFASLEENYQQELLVREKEAQLIGEKKAQALLLKEMLKANQRFRILSGGAIGSLTEEKAGLREKLNHVKDSTEIAKIYKEIDSIEKEIALIKLERQKRKLDPNDKEGLAALEAEFVKQYGFASEKNGLKSKRFQELFELDILQDEVRLDKRHHREFARALNQYYSAENKALETRVLRSKQDLELGEQQASQIGSNAKKLESFASDTQVGPETRLSRNLSAQLLYAESAKVENSAIQQLIKTYQENNARMTDAIITLKDVLNSGNLTGDAKATATNLIADYESKIEKNTLEVVKLTGKQDENNKSLAEQKQQLQQNTEALKTEGYRFKTPDKIRRGAELRGETFESTSGQSEDFSLGFKDTPTRFFETLYKDSAKAYEGFDALTELSYGLSESISNMGDNAAGAFSKFVTGAESGKHAVKGFLMSMLQDLEQMASKILMNQLMQMLIGSFATGFGGGDTVLAGTPASVGPVAWNGGLVMTGNYAAGGLITTGLESRDSTYAKVAKGEFIVRSEAVKAIGVDRLRALNSLDRSSINNIQPVANPEPNPQGLSQDQEKKGDTNIYVVLERLDETNLGPNDVVQVITSDLMRNGPVKKLVRKISQGQM